MRLLTNNPDKRAGLEGYGLTVLGRVPLPVRAVPENLRYLSTKRDRMGHDLPDLPTRQVGVRPRRSWTAGPAPGERCPLGARSWRHDGGSGSEGRMSGDGRPALEVPDAYRPAPGRGRDDGGTPRSSTCCSSGRWPWPGRPA